MKQKISAGILIFGFVMVCFLTGAITFGSNDKFKGLGEIIYPVTKEHGDKAFQEKYFGVNW